MDSRSLFSDRVTWIFNFTLGLLNFSMHFQQLTIDENSVKWKSWFTVVFIEKEAGKVEDMYSLWISANSRPGKRTLDITTICTDRRSIFPFHEEPLILM